MANKRCGWCQNLKGKTDLNFSIIDDDFAQNVPVRLIKYCPFCGRYVKERQQPQASWKDAVMRTFLGGNNNG